jgi:hypothetical protein
MASLMWLMSVWIAGGGSMHDTKQYVNTSSHKICIFSMKLLRTSGNACDENLIETFETSSLLWHLL